MQIFNKAQLDTAILQEAPKRAVAVKLKDGTILSLSDLPARSTTRWVASTKAAIVRVFMAGLIGRDELIERYDLSAEEFDSWLNHYIQGGNHALKTTKARNA